VPVVNLLAPEICQQIIVHARLGQSDGAEHLDTFLAPRRQRLVLDRLARVLR
jgi:hypothetical protein